MLDPHVRADLHPISQGPGASATKYTTDFKAPDRHGVFKFLVDYKRPGWVMR
jgi:oligosaccharyltransferase complex subunit beta